ncbi:jg10990 [Pararge aegeria aegeria]|uniref:Jg10990 protein n=1 Tax=Pararge aegeria aegeria TaxID=348720 RepID=A0A8S4SB17_9NEOP|nr:jg10990 [Pararge aegeria aegeria]
MLSNACGVHQPALGQRGGLRPQPVLIVGGDPCPVGLRVTTIIGSFGTCAGAWLKVFSVPQDMFWLGFTGQTVVAVAQVFILNLPPRLAAVWFGADQVSSACSIGVFGNQGIPKDSKKVSLKIDDLRGAVL